MTHLEVMHRLLVITAIAGAIGFERERHGRAAGFRTHILVGLGSCVVMLTGIFLSQTMPHGAAIDPTRMASQVVSGIGFLGAGTILRSRASIRGLTTAASLWAVGGLGLAVGSGFLSGAAMAGALIIVVLFGLSGFERAMRKEQYQVLVVEMSGKGQALARLRGVLNEYDIEIRDLDIHEGKQDDHVRLEIQVKLLQDHSKDEIVSKVTRLEHVIGAHWA